MKTRLIEAARIDFAVGEPGLVKGQGPRFVPRQNAIARARRMFLRGNQLPQAWAQHPCFVIMETGFALGHNFLATWRAWRRDPKRCARLVYIAIEQNPPTQADLARAHAASALPAWQQTQASELVRSWPALTPNLHQLRFDNGQVNLLLGLGDIGALLPQIHARVDAFFLDGFAPEFNREMFDSRVVKALARRAAVGASLVSAGSTAPLSAHLVSAGFDVNPDPRHHTLHARFAPRFAPRPIQLSARSRKCAASSQAVVVGAGLAGAWAAHELARRGWSVTVLDRHASAAQGASGNPAALFHGTVHEDDGPHARLFRAAALHAQRQLHPLIQAGLVPGQAAGLLRINPRVDPRLDPRIRSRPASPFNSPTESSPDALTFMRQLIACQRLPAQYVQALSSRDACALSGVALQHPAWFYPGGGWLDAAALVRHLLAGANVQFRPDTAVARIHHDGELWQTLSGSGDVLTEAPVLVLADADGHSSLITPLGLQPWPLQNLRGQISAWQGTRGTKGMPSALVLPVAGDGYAVPLACGGVLCGASSQLDDDTAQLRMDDHRSNFARLRRLTGLVAPEDIQLWQGRVAWRTHTPDRLPIVGPVPALLGTHPTNHRLDQARLALRCPGLFVTTAFGGRGVTLAPLAGALLAAQISGEPLPLEQDLVDALDPVRWRIRLARQGLRRELEEL